MNAPGKPCRRFHVKQAKRKQLACALPTTTGGKFMAARVRSVALKDIVTGVANDTRAHAWSQRTSSQNGLVDGTRFAVVVGCRWHLQITGELKAEQPNGSLDFYLQIATLT